MTYTSAPNSVYPSSASSATPSLAASDIIRASQETEADSQCRSCVQLLKQVLHAADSRPTQLLQSLFDLESGESDSSPSKVSSTLSPPAAVSATPRLRWRHSVGGLQVEIPAPAEDDGAKGEASAGICRRWSRLHPTEQVEQPKRGRSLPLSLLSERQLATSALPPESDHAAAKQKAESKAQHHKEDHPKTEWLSIRCQPCQETGPEGGARAFVMGPSPLSIIVCTNRLKHNAANAPRHERSTFALAQNEIEEILTHELVHVYDVRKLQLDLRDCESLAYSEVRAAREAECRHFPDLHASETGPLSRPSWYTLPGMTASKLACASQTAQAATSNMVSNRRLARECVDRVLDHAFKDTRPFRKPNHG